ncbi:MAG TPA: fatty acid desaturase [Candidatus Binatia bacterium]
MGIWALHLLCFVLPVSCTLFLGSAPHPWYGALSWLLIVAVSIVLDMRSPAERRQPLPTLPGWPFDGVLYALAALQLLNVALLVRVAAVEGAWTADAFVGLVMVGIGSGYSGFVVAHELIHRSSRGMQLVGRIMLCTTLYEHFFTEHVRGHHSRVGTEDDPATARFGERSDHFFLRTVPAQFRSAWRLEVKRVGATGRFDPRLLQSRVVHGLVAEWSIAIAIAALLGVGAFAIYLLQALIAVRLLEAVNYFEHWGLSRTTRRVRTIDSWDTDSWFTLYTLVGLSRHADHHAYAARPYQQLRYVDESPKLPYGYFGTVVLALFRKQHLRRLLSEELERRRLGPFAATDSSAA